MLRFYDKPKNARNIGAFYEWFWFDFWKSRKWLYPSVNRTENVFSKGAVSEFEKGFNVRLFYSIILTHLEIFPNVTFRKIKFCTEFSSVANWLFMVFVMFDLPPLASSIEKSLIYKRI